MAHGPLVYHGIYGNKLIYFKNESSRICIVDCLKVYIILYYYINLFLVYETPSYEAKLEIHYVTTDTLASNCIAGFEKMLALYNTTIAQSIYEKCSDLAPGRFVITSLSITAYSFKV